MKTLLFFVAAAFSFSTFAKNQGNSCEDALSTKEAPLKVHFEMAEVESLYMDIVRKIDALTKAEEVSLSQVEDFLESKATFFNRVTEMHLGIVQEMELDLETEVNLSTITAMVYSLGAKPEHFGIQRDENGRFGVARMTSELKKSTFEPAKSSKPRIGFVPFKEDVEDDHTRYTIGFHPMREVVEESRARLKPEIGFVPRSELPHKQEPVRPLDHIEVIFSEKMDFTQVTDAHRDERYVFSMQISQISAMDSETTQYQLIFDPSDSRWFVRKTKKNEKPRKIGF